MKLLTKHTDYAINALLVLAKNKKLFISAREIAKKQGIPYQFLRRILRELIKNNLVISKEGSGGGFKIKINPNTLKITDVIKIFQGNIQLVQCIFRKKLCLNYSTCVLKKQIRGIEKIVVKKFSGITIGSLLRDFKRS